MYRVVIFLLISMINTGCIQTSNDDEVKTSSPKEPTSLTLPGTIKIDPKKEYDLSKYSNIDFDRALIESDNGASFNLSRSTVLRSKKIWFPKTGKTTISLYKNGSPITTEVLR